MIEEFLVQCDECGSQIDRRFTFCPWCGDSRQDSARKARLSLLEQLAQVRSLRPVAMSTRLEFCSQSVPLFAGKGGAK